ncbi:MAG: Hsp20 family protein [Patescibacteria group bacterium]
MVSLMRIKPWYMPMVPGGPFADDDFEDNVNNFGLNIYEKNGSVCVEAPVPGIPADNVEVTYTEGKIHIYGKYEEKEDEKNKKQQVYKMERSSEFEYVADIPNTIDEKSIEAEVKDGVVYITAKVAEASKPKKIQVKSKKQ